MSNHYDIHPSTELRELFASMPIPYQGRNPEQASVIFVGLDANYSADLFVDAVFSDLMLEYHRDGVAFWQKHNKHHPFLLEEYPLKKNRGGVTYHRKFETMGLTAKHAEFISFVELLDVPTVGSTEKKKFWQLFNLEHARQLDAIFTSGADRLVLLSGSVLRNMQHAKNVHGIFSWLPATVTRDKFHQIGKTEFHLVRHFSSDIPLGELKFMGRLIDAQCTKTGSKPVD